MWQSRLTMVMALVLFSISTTYAQLGPKDKANMPSTDLERVKVGDHAPDFTLEDVDGKRISLTDFHGKKDVVLIFYRGHW